MQNVIILHHLKFALWVCGWQQCTRLAARLSDHFMYIYRHKSCIELHVITQIINVDHSQKKTAEIQHPTL
ncbi:hypothetical protein JZ751_002503 [Albula glossodonta]|uniref:Secreted protein n=1 Tax=Albula glossodonta TaxID=121402 RepID=A0A8T2N899_9TELE|nr:hypothetical protein JZ751_002503 [Albula glossodonta]